jgi:deazaflavin-dependent oxidoreductase (nitroreductase family)
VSWLSTPWWCDHATRQSTVLSGLFVNDRLLKAASTFHTVLYRMSRGRLGRRLVNNDMAILRTIGRVTGKSHAVPLLVLIDGDDWIVQRDSERRSEGDAESYTRGPSGLARRAQSGKWPPSSDESEIPPSWIVIASHGGRPRHPEWYRNLEANPLAQFQVGSRRYAVEASTMGDEERAVWWPRIVEAFAGYADYASRTDRKIPVVRLSVRKP